MTTVATLVAGTLIILWAYSLDLPLAGSCLFIGACIAFEFYLHDMPIAAAVAGGVGLLVSLVVACDPEAK